MIELQTGKISFPALKVTMSPLTSEDSFLTAFPQGHCHRLKDASTGCAW